ncbi:50S ribosomal protein L13 [archaeon]|nr:50S ribosomal protein L13 [archaeon]
MSETRKVEERKVHHKKQKPQNREPRQRNLLVIDATNLIAGRLASWVAKQALMGNQVAVVNSEKAIMTGDLHKIVARYQYLRTETGTPFTGPFLSRLADRFLRRIIKRMLPFKRPRGASAYKRIMCYLGVPDEFAGKAKTLKEADASNTKTIKFTTIEQICKLLGIRRP